MHEVKKRIIFSEWDGKMDFEEYEKCVADEIEYQCKKHGLTEVRELAYHELTNIYKGFYPDLSREVRVFELKGIRP